MSKISVKMQSNSVASSSVLKEDAFVPANLLDAMKASENCLEVV